MNPNSVNINTEFIISTKVCLIYRKYLASASKVNNIYIITVKKIRGKY